MMIRVGSGRTLKRMGGLKSLLSVGGVAVVSITPKIVVAVPIVLMYLPPGGAVTSTVTVQEPGTLPVLPGMVPPLRVMVPVFAIAVRVPRQVLVVVDGDLIDMFVGKVSVNAAGTGLVPGLLNVMLRVETLPTPASMMAGLKTLVSGGVGVAVGVAVGVWDGVFVGVRVGVFVAV